MQNTIPIHVSAITKTSGLIKKVSNKVKRDVDKQNLHKDELAYRDMIRERWFIISSSSKIYQYWDWLVMTLAIYNCLWTPLTISFDWADNQGTNVMFLQMFEWVVFVIYSVDIIIQFNSSYI